MLCTNIVLNVKTKINFCTQHVLNLYYSGNSMNNLSSYCELTDSRVGASEKKLPVQKLFYSNVYFRAEVGILASGVNS